MVHAADRDDSRASRRRCLGARGAPCIRCARGRRNNRVEHLPDVYRRSQALSGLPGEDPVEWSSKRLIRVELDLPGTSRIVASGSSARAQAKARQRCPRRDVVGGAGAASVLTRRRRGPYRGPSRRCGRAALYGPLSGGWGADLQRADAFPRAARVVDGERKGCSRAASVLHVRVYGCGAGEGGKGRPHAERGERQTNAQGNDERGSPWCPRARRRPP